MEDWIQRLKKYKFNNDLEDFNDFQMNSIHDNLNIAWEASVRYLQTIKKEEVPEDLLTKYCDLQFNTYKFLLEKKAERAEIQLLIYKWICDYKQFEKGEENGFN